MLLKRFFCAVSAAVALIGCLALPAGAEAEEEKEIIEFKADTEMLSDDASAPTISFDTSDWEKYVHLTADGEAMGIKMSQDTDTFYQGASLKVYSDCEGIEAGRYYNYGNSVRDDDGNLLYPEASAEDTAFVTPGIELRAEDFGLSCFDGCMVTFLYRMGTDTENKLMESSVYAFPADEEYNHLANNPVKLTYDTVLNDNVSQYRKLMVTVAADASATKIVFQTPVMQKVTSDIFYIDNITVVTPLEDNGADLYVKNLDGYNENAKPQEIIESVKIQQQGKTLSQAESRDEESEGSFNPMIIVIAVLAAALVAIVILVVIKHKNKFY
ncbi:hypothetical protein [Ruminococcus sp. Marseille-P6503]|uniref:hypothetical protein n=1 Tax=Ruminococcus sp. Marseille-P6503 TaxID=2364796 RepID=UPI000F53215E|nr:hypothetical protein [Ruminococcus sp. Marseille-P6503]